ncbi:MAG: hypothetical protein ABIR47_04065 [Candidatus Kapaibacterium sp.]
METTPASPPVSGDLPARIAGLLVAALLAPLPFLGDLRVAHVPYLAFVTAATVLLYIAYWLLGRRGIVPTRRTIIGIALLLRLLTLPMLPSLSDDAYRYLWDGRLLLHGVNPYLHVPADSSLSRFHDELFHRQGYPTTNTIYPPGTQLVFAAGMAVSELAGSEYMVGYYAYKLMTIAAEMLGIMLAIAALEKLGIPLRHILLYAWHPLAVVELAGQGHTDAFWVLGLAGGLYGYACGGSGGGLGALAFGGGMRLYPLPLLALWFRWLDRRALIAGAILAVPSLLLLGALLDPDVLKTYSTVLGRFTNFYEFNGGFYYAIKGWFDYLHIKPSNVIAGNVCTGTHLMLLMAILLWPLRRRTVEGLAWRALLITTLQIVLGAKVHIWYFTAPLILLPFIPGGRLRKAWLWAALVGPFTYLTYVSSIPRERTEILVIEWGGFLLLAIADGIAGAIRKKPDIVSDDELPVSSA